jgi:outer membrane protein W
MKSARARSALRVVKPVVAAFALLLGVNADVAAQFSTMTGFTWGTALPASGTKDFTDAFSWANVGFETRAISGTTSVGFSIGWNVFDDVVDETRTLAAQPVTVTGRQFRSTNALPILLTAHKYLGPMSTAHAYVGAGVGTIFARNRLDVGIVSVDEDHWHFAMVPEVGFEFPVNNALWLYVNAKYNWGVSNDGVSPQFFGFNIGVSSR